MRFGISTGPQNITWDEVRSRWLRADRNGFESGWLVDHIIAITGNIDHSIFEAWSTLAGLAEATENITLGTLVTCNTLRHPAMLAKITTTVDHVSHGRVVVGIGTGYFEPEHELFGTELPPVRERGEMLAESVQILRGLWSEGRFTFTGKHYTITDAPSEPLPVQSRIPILIGGSGEQRTLRTVARYADMWNMPPGAQGVTVESFRAKHAVLIERCEEIGRDPGEIEPVLAFTVLINENGQTAIERRRKMAEAMGMSEEVASQHILAGDPSSIGETLLRFEEAGAQHVIVGAGHRFLEDDIELLAESVIKRQHTTTTPAV